MGFAAREVMKLLANFALALRISEAMDDVHTPSSSSTFCTMNAAAASSLALTLLLATNSEALILLIAT